MDIKLKSLLILFQVYSVFCFGQQNLKTEYVYDDTSKLNLSLTGQIEYVKEITENLKTGNNEEREYFFKENGDPVKIIETSLGVDILNRKLRNEQIVYEFERGKLLSELNTIEEGLDGYTYKYDDYGNLMNKRFFVQNSIVSEENFEYDNQNRLVKFTKYVFGYYRLNNEEAPDNKSDYISMIRTYEYDDDDGNLVEDTMNNIKGNIFKRHLYKYDDHGYKIEEGWCKGYKGLDSIKKCDYNPSIGWDYNEKNQKIKKFAIGNWSPHNTDTYFKYDNKGREIEVKGYYIKKDTVLGYHFKYEYDDFGNKIKDEEVIGKYRSLGFDRYKTEVKKYDEFQNITLEEYITSDNKRIKVVKYKYSYDEKGNWIDRKKLEGKTHDELEESQIISRVIKYYN